MPVDNGPPELPVLCVQDLIYYHSRGVLCEIVEDFRSNLRMILIYWVQRYQTTTGDEREEAKDHAWDTINLMSQLI